MSGLPGVLLQLVATADSQEFGHIAASDWQRIDCIARQHRLQPWLHHLHRDNAAVPESIRSGWAAAYRLSAAVALTRQADLAASTACLRAGGFAPLALKGSWLAFQAYPHPALRPMRDIDLLLDPAEVIDAYAWLQRHGYSRDPSPAAPFEDLVRRNKHLPPLRGPHGTWIELHHLLWEPAGELDHASPTSDLAGLRARSVLGADGIAYPGAEDMLIHLIVHATHGHRLDCGPLILIDLDLLLRLHQVDWPGFWHRARDEGWRAGARLLLELTAHYRGTAIDLTADTGPPVPEGIKAMAPRLLTQAEASRTTTYALARVLRRGPSDLIRRLPAILKPATDHRGAAATVRPEPLGGRISQITSDVLSRSALRTAWDMAKFSRWLDRDAR